MHEYFFFTALPLALFRQCKSGLRKLKMRFTDERSLDSFYLKTAIERE
jgi:hypothetical protein